MLCAILIITVVEPDISSFDLHQYLLKRCGKGGAGWYRTLWERMGRGGGEELWVGAGGGEGDCYHESMQCIIILL